jgi:hypothetical protein
LLNGKEDASALERASEACREPHAEADAVSKGVVALIPFQNTTINAELAEH